MKSKFRTTIINEHCETSKQSVTKRCGWRDLTDAQIEFERAAIAHELHKIMMCITYQISRYKKYI